MNSNWNGIPENPERTAQHWFINPEDEQYGPYLVWWFSEGENKWWDRPVESMGLKYLGPCLFPSEIEEIRKNAFRKGQIDMQKRAIEITIKAQDANFCEEIGYYDASAESIGDNIRYLSIKDKED